MITKVVGTIELSEWNVLTPLMGTEHVSKEDVLMYLENEIKNIMNNTPRNQPPNLERVGTLRGLINLFESLFSVTFNTKPPLIEDGKCTIYWSGTNI